MQDEEKLIATKGERDALLMILEGIKLITQPYDTEGGIIHSVGAGGVDCFLNYCDDGACINNSETYWACLVCSVLAEGMANRWDNNELAILREHTKKLKAIQYCKHCGEPADLQETIDSGLAWGIMVMGRREVAIRPSQRGDTAKICEDCKKKAKFIVKELEENNTWAWCGNCDMRSKGSRK